MSLYLGLDTSNYTTSAALLDSGKGEMRQAKKLLPVKPGEMGLRQSDAVFHHVRQLPEVLEEVRGQAGGRWPPWQPPTGRSRWRARICPAS